MPFLKLLQPNPIPFRFLLYTEWVLLAACGSLAVWEAIESHRIPLTHLGILLTLWLLGFWLPTKHHWVKSLYTAVAISLVFIGAMLGYLHILPMLYLIVVIRSCFLFQAAGRWAVAGVIWALFLLHQIQYSQTVRQVMNLQWQERIWMHLLAETLMFGFGLFLVLKLANSLLAEKKAQAQLVESHQQLQTYAHQLRIYAEKVEDLASAEERNRIAREIHDSLGHALTALFMQLQSALRYWEVNLAQTREFLEQSLELADHAIREVRRSVSTLRAETVITLNMQNRFLSLAKEFHHCTGIAVHTHFTPGLVLPEPIATAFYRVAQEALTNVGKHADATTVWLVLEEVSQKVVLTVEDNGQGFEVSQSSSGLYTAESGGFGLRGMQERIAALGGELEIATSPDAGCRISAKVPIASHQERIGSNGIHPSLTNR